MGSGGETLGGQLAGREGHLWVGTQWGWSWLAVGQHWLPRSLWGRLVSGRHWLLGTLCR